MELKEQLQKALAELRKDKERKFDQTVDLIINLQKFDPKRNAINLIVSVPFKFKDKKICAFLESENKSIPTITSASFKKYSDKKALKNDYLNIGHCYWAAGRLDMALESYRQAVNMSNHDEKWFRNAFHNDLEYLKKTGIDDLDVALMIDYVLIV